MLSMYEHLSCGQNYNSNTYNPVKDIVYGNGFIEKITGFDHSVAIRTKNKPSVPLIAGVSGQSTTVSLVHDSA